MIQLQDVGVKFHTNTKKQDLKSYLFDFVRGKRKKKKEFWALNSVSMKASEGEAIGIIGSNGAGKSTLCRVIAKILYPDKGSIEVNGMVSALLSLGTGFNAELTGRENVYLNGMMLGFSKKEIAHQMDEILDFADIGEFIDQPIKHYSKGMKSRLGFSVAAMLQPDILVLDEALTTGDEDFKKKASKKMKEILKTARLVILVSHDLDFVEEHCTHAIWVEKGLVVQGGTPGEVCKAYKEKKVATPAPKKKKLLQDFKRTEAEIVDEEVLRVDNLGIKFKVNKHDFWALRKVSFSLSKGEILGIIGHNGAGKSTLCMALSQIMKPDEGTVTVKGRTTELFGFGAGFSPQLTGVDNIYLNGLLLGIPKQRLQDMYTDIVEFSELGEFIDSPVKVYSSGMKARLGFSIATSTEPEILIVDEALSTGDYHFFQKAAKRIQEIISSAKAVVVVTHNMNFVRDVCTRAIVISNGQIRFDGTPLNAINIYQSQIM
jgi:teichoic acid transport system ATP-binding protein